MTKKKTKKVPIRSIGVLCSGGDAPGMNAAVRAVVRYGIYNNLNVFGITKGYSGLLEGNIKKLSLRSVANIIQRGGTILKTDRCKAFFEASTRKEAVHLLRRKKIDALVVIGGDGSYTGGHLMGTENSYPVVGLPGTIDNDIYGSEYSIGFDTAVNTALEAIDRIRDTANSHDRVFLVEVMGRTSAEIAVRVGLSGGAESICVPATAGRQVVDNLVTSLKRSVQLGKLSSIVIVAEGVRVGRLAGAQVLAQALKTKAQIDAKVAVLGHVQRGGTPSAMDRYMASLMGVEAVQALLDGEQGIAVGIKNGTIARIPFQSILGEHKKVDMHLVKLCEILAS